MHCHHTWGHLTSTCQVDWLLIVYGHYFTLWFWYLLCCHCTWRCFTFALACTSWYWQLVNTCHYHHTSIWVPTYLFKLNIVFLDMPFTSQASCLPSISNQYKKLAINCRQVLFFSSNLDGLFNYYVISLVTCYIYVASTR